MKRVVLFMISVAMMMTLVGCGTNSSKDVKAIKYLEKKYAKAFDDEFEIDSAEYADFFHGADTFFIKSKRLPDNIIKVRYQKGKYTDNYIALYYLKDSENAVQQIVESILGECTVVCEPAYYPTDEFEGNTTFDDFIHSNTNPLFSKIIIRDVENFSDSNFDKIIEKLKQSEIPHSTLHFMVLNEYKKFDNAEQLNKVVDEERYPYVESRFIELNEDYEVISRDEGLRSKIKK